jgi:hypothetical protein
MGGYLIGLLIGFIIAIMPPILILFSKNVQGKTKVWWFLGALTIPFLFKFVATVVVTIVQGHIMPMGLSPLIPLAWYLSAWVIYFIFRAKQKRGKPIKIKGEE